MVIRWKTEWGSSVFGCFIAFDIIVMNFLYLEKCVTLRSTTFIVCIN